MTPTEHWYADEANLLWLASILNDPRWQLATAAVYESRKPRWTPELGAEVIVNAGSNMLRLQGLYEFEEQLISLRQPPAKGPEPLPQRYADEDVREWAIKNMGHDPFKIPPPMKAPEERAPGSPSDQPTEFHP